MKIAILGSTGFVGKVLIKKAVAAGYDVKTLARTPEKLAALSDKVTIIKGSLFEALPVEETIRGVDAVISAIGPPPGEKCDPLLYEKAMQNIVGIMNKYGIKRYIHIGGAAHDGGINEDWSFGRRFLRFFLGIVSREILEAKKLEWEVLKSSDLDWTLIRPPRIAKGKAPGNVLAGERKLESLKVNVENLTDFILEQINSNEWIRKAPLVSSGRN